MVRSIIKQLKHLVALGCPENLEKVFYILDVVNLVSWDTVRAITFIRVQKCLMTNLLLNRTKLLGTLYIKTRMWVKRCPVVTYSSNVVFRGP